jgi:predicted transcriptional regulator
MNNSTQILKILAGDTRYRLLNQLLESPDYTISLAKKLNLESSIITHQLKKLEREGLLFSYRRGKLKYYEIKNKQALKSIFSNLNKLNTGGN